MLVQSAGCWAVAEMGDPASEKGWSSAHTVAATAVAAALDQGVKGPEQNDPNFTKTYQAIV